MKDFALYKLLTSRVRMALFLALLPLVYFHEAIVGPLILAQGDGWHAVVGLRDLLGQMLSHGELPLWNPYLFGGMPLLADIYAAVFNPLNWIFAFAPPRFSMNFVVLVSFEIGIAGAYRFARNLGLERLSASVTAIGFGFSGYLVMSLGQTPNLGTAVWLPWMLLAVEKLARQCTWRWIALGAVFLAWQFFSGLPQPFWYSSLTVAAYSLFAWRYRATVSRTFLLSLGLLFTSGVLLCGVQLLPLYQLQQQSWRAGLSYEEFAAYSLPIRQTVALLVPYFFGGATQWPFKLSYQGADGIFITCGYVGLLCWLLAAVAWFCHTSEQRKQVFFWSATAFVALCLAYGDNLPFGLNHLLYRLPVYNLFRASFRHQYEFGFALALLAGFGCEALRVADRQTLRRIFISFGALFGLLLSVFLWRQRAQFQWWLPELIFPVVFTSLSLTVAWWYAWHPQSAARLCLPLILFADLMAYGFGLPWRQYRFDVTTALQDPPAVQFIKQREHDFNAFRIVSHAAQPFQLEHALDYPNNSIVRRLASVNGYDMLQISRTAHLLGSMTPDGLLTDQSVFNPAHRGLDLLILFGEIRRAGGVLTQHGELALLELDLLPGLFDHRVLRLEDQVERGHRQRQQHDEKHELSNHG